MKKLINRIAKPALQGTVVEKRIFSLPAVAPERKIARLTSLEDFRLLSEGTKVNSIINGKITHYLFVKENFKCEGYFIMINSGDYTEAVVVKPNFDHSRHFWFVGYNSKLVGDEIIRQTHDLIESYKEIYSHE